MDISPASTAASGLGIGSFIDDDPFASIGAYAGDAESSADSDDAVEVPTSNARIAEPQDRLVDDMRSSVAGLESRFAAFTHLLRRELTTLENRCAAAMRSLFAPSSTHPAPKSGEAGAGSHGPRAEAPADDVKATRTPAAWMITPLSFPTKTRLRRG